MNTTITRSRWAAIGAAVAVTLGAGGIGLVSATSPADAVAYVPIEPCRITDTRAGEFNVGPRNTPIGQIETHMITAHGDNGDCVGIPTTATGLQLNVTSLSATNGTFLTVWGTGGRPTVSSLNPQPNQPPIPNAVTTGLTATGVFNIYNAVGTVDVIVDIVGYYTDHNHDDRYYTETEVNAALSAKANSADVNTALSAKANTAEVYTQSESNQRFDNAEAAIASSSTSVGLTPTAATVASVTIDTPTSGYVILNSGGYFFNSVGDVIAFCSISTGTTMDVDASFEASVGVSGSERVPAGSTRGWEIDYGFNWPSAETTFRLICDSNGAVEYRNPQLTAIFRAGPGRVRVGGSSAQPSATEPNALLTAAWRNVAVSVALVLGGSSPHTGLVNVDARGRSRSRGASLARWR